MSEENANTTVEMVEDILDAVVEPEKANILVPAVIAIATFSLGGVLGYILAKRNLEKKYDQMLEEEIKRTADHIANTLKETERKVAKSEAAPRQQTRVNPKKSLQELKAELGYDDANEEDEPSILINGKKLADSIVEETVDTSGPYVISEEDFNENVDDYEQMNLAYYTEDDILADESDEAMGPVEAVDSIVGSENLKSFGRNSRDPNVIFVRNDESKTLFEIVRIRGSYVKLVLGFDGDDSVTERLRKFRIDE